MNRSDFLVSKKFGRLTYGLREMKDHLPQHIYRELLKTVHNGKELSSSSAESIATAIKDWAVSHGATHFCHWFQPLTGSTAEKHDSFINVHDFEHAPLKVLESFTGSQLTQGEPDASSFPSGGLRSTFEARGYTVWDPCSPVFLMKNGRNYTLCLPSIFFSYGGEALDYKTPLLRSCNKLSKSLCSILKKLGDVDAKKIDITVGAEQEYFLIDKFEAEKRPDLIITGKTLLGSSAAKGQQLNDHYFGAIPSRVSLFMSDLESKLYDLGIPAKTRHNEVAPCQFELAPIYESAPIAADHNVLMMEVMKKTARENDFICILNEKPFKGLNGSGKHCNWSLRNDKGENLFEPGKTPHQNLRFLTLVSLFIAAINKHAEILSSSTMTPSNEDRLGGNEAPPGIISIFLGNRLEEIFDNLSSGNSPAQSESKALDLGIEEIPHFTIDDNDRNRTSPIAFTGNKFEFRSVGSSMNISLPVTIINAAFTDVLEDYLPILQEHLDLEENKHLALIKFISKVYRDNKNIIYSGNCYSQDWKDIASKNGLKEIKDSIEAYQAFSSKELHGFLSERGIYTKNEINLHSKHILENYNNINLIEQNLFYELVQQYTIPSIERQIHSTMRISSADFDTHYNKVIEDRLSKFRGYLVELVSKSTRFYDILEALKQENDQNSIAETVCKKLRPLKNEMRSICDKAEVDVDAEFWHLSRYRDLLFSTKYF